MTDNQFAADRAASGRRIVTRRVLITVLVIVLTVVFVYPVLMLFLGALNNNLPYQGGTLSFDGIVAAFTSPDTWTTIRSSLILVVIGTIVATVLGGLFAWVSTSTNTPGRRLLTPAMICMLFVPPLFYGFGWIMLANKQNGLLNTAFNAIGIAGSPLNIQSWPGLIFTTSLGYVPFAYLLLIGAFRNREQSLDEASQMSGAGLFRTFFRVTLPSIGPTITGVAALLIVLIFQAFDIPQLLGQPVKIYVFSTQIYHYVNDFTPGKYSSAFSLALVMVALVVILFLVQRRLLRGRTFTTLSGKSSQREPLPLGKIRFVFAAVMWVFILLNLVLPLAAVVLGSLQPIFGVMGRLTLQNYTQVLTSPQLTGSLVLTAQMAAIGGLIAMSIALVLAYIMARQRGFIQSYTSLAVWVPWALPGVVMALAYLWAILTVPPVAAALYGTTALVAGVLVIATIPLVSRIAEGALVQLSPELEEAARMSGAGTARVLIGIVLRLLLPSFLSGWFLSALFISGNLAVPAILAPPGVQPVSITAYNLYVSGNAAAGAALFVMILAAAVVVLIVAAIARFAFRAARAGGQRQRASGPTRPRKVQEPAITIQYKP